MAGEKEAPSELVVPLKVTVLAEVETSRPWEPVTPAFCVAVQVAGAVFSSLAARARQAFVAVSMTRKPVPLPETLASARMSPRTDMLVEPLAPPPCPADSEALVMLRLAPLPRPAMTSEPVPVEKFSGWLLIAAVGLELSVKVVAPVIAVIVAPEGMAALPLTYMPTARPAVLGTVTLALPLMVVALTVAPA